MNDYNKWLAMTDPEREQMADTWDVYQREGYKVALMAIARLSFASALPIVDAQVGVGHGGRWILHVTCHQNAQMLCEVCPQTFEGFDVLWLQMGNDGSPHRVF
jgi:hypothetical protein